MSAAEALVIDELRRAAARKFRELADRLESGELQGARVQWREGQEHVECVELDYSTGEVRFSREACSG